MNTGIRKLTRQLRILRGRITKKPCRRVCIHGYVEQKNCYFCTNNKK